MSNTVIGQISDCQIQNSLSNTNTNFKTLIYLVCTPVVPRQYPRRVQVSKAARLLHLEELERLCDAPASPAPKEASVTPHHPDPKPADAPSDAPPGGGDAPAPERGAEGQQKAPFGSPDSISAVIDRLIHYEKSASDPEYGGGGGGAAGGFPTAPGGPPVFPFPSLMDAAAAGAAGADAVRVSASLAGIGLEHDGATEAGKAVAAAAMRAGYPPVTPGTPNPNPLLNPRTNPLTNPLPNPVPTLSQTLSQTCPIPLQNPVPNPRPNPLLHPFPIGGRICQFR